MVVSKIFLWGILKRITTGSTRVAIQDIGITENAAADLNEEDLNTLGWLVNAILEDLDSWDLPSIACCVSVRPTQVSFEKRPSGPG